jgi:hypothetical protein
MVYLIRSARALQGRAQAALPWAVEVVNYVNEHYPEVHMEVWRNIDGYIDQVHLVARYESLAAMEATKRKLDQDDEYQKLVGSFQSLFDLRSAVDNHYETIP